MEAPDVVVVGSGIAGGAISTVLTRAGLSVVALERDARPMDRVRGEWMVPWGVEELRQLDLHGVLSDAGAHHATTHIPYSDESDPLAAERAARDLTGLFPDVPGPLALGHPSMCTAFAHAALANGAAVLRGVRGLFVEPGYPPKVSFDHDGQTFNLCPRLVVGADGRGSTVARQAGITINKDRATHLLGGLLVDTAHGWPQHVHTLGTEGNTHFAICPQGNGKVRVYLTSPLAKRRQISKNRNAMDFLRGFRLTCAPPAASIADAVPDGPLQYYPNADHWADEPIAPGVVLIGDAAGHNDPTIGQGLAIAMRDVRMVSELLLSSSDWSEAHFRPYIDEHRERLRRLRIVAKAVVSFRMHFGEAGQERRRRIARMAQRSSKVAELLSVQLLGPGRVSVEAFDQATLDQIYMAT